MRETALSDRILLYSHSDTKKRHRPMELPNDPMMLFSTVNMYLRDKYESLDELCADLDVDRAELEEKLRTVGFEYSAEHNKFW